MLQVWRWKHNFEEGVFSCKFCLDRCSSGDSWFSYFHKLYWSSWYTNQGSRPNNWRGIFLVVWGIWTMLSVIDNKSFDCGCNKSFDCGCMPGKISLWRFEGFGEARLQASSKVIAQLELLLSVISGIIFSNVQSWKCLFFSFFFYFISGGNYVVSAGYL